MATISWGKPKIEVCAFVSGALPVSPVWTPLTNIKQDSTKLTTSKGAKEEAKIEGGELLDVRFSKNGYSLECELYVAKGASKPITDVDGVVDVNYAVRVTPEDATQAGFIIDKASVQLEESFTAKDGKTWKYTFEALKPATGELLKEYTEE